MRWEVIRLYVDGQRLSDREISNATPVPGEVLTSTTTNGKRDVFSAHLEWHARGKLPPLVEPRLAGIAHQGIGLEGYEAVERNGVTIISDSAGCVENRVVSRMSPISPKRSLAP